MMINVRLTMINVQKTYEAQTIHMMFTARSYPRHSTPS